MPLQTLIVQALRQMIRPSSASTPQWSKVILYYEGTPDFPAFESYRDELFSF